MTRRRWSDEEAELFKTLWINPNLTRDDLCNILRRSYKSIDGKASALRLKQRPVKPSIDYAYLKKLTELTEG